MISFGHGPHEHCDLIGGPLGPLQAIYGTPADLEEYAKRLRARAYACACAAGIGPGAECPDGYGVTVYCQAEREGAAGAPEKKETQTR